MLETALLETVRNLINYDIKIKKNALYLMKVGAKVKVSACKWIIFIQYKFPVLDPRDYVPYKVISIPKKINNNYFSLEKIPHYITWGEKVYSFSQEEIRSCTTVDTDILCKKPEMSDPLLNNCIYGMANFVKWVDLAPKCNLVQETNPKDMITVTQSNVIYFFKEEEFIYILCRNFTKPAKLVGSGSLKIPSGCKIKYKGEESFSLNHLKITDRVEFNLDNSVYYQNFEQLLELFEIRNKSDENLMKMDISKEERVIREGLDTVDGIMEQFQFSQKSIHITLWGLIGYAIVTSGFIVGLIICFCRPDGMVFCKKCCCPCGYKKPHMDGVEMGEF